LTFSRSKSFLDCIDLWDSSFGKLSCERIEYYYETHSSEYEKLFVMKGVVDKAQKALDAANDYYETHRQQITLYNAAEQYLKDVLQQHFDPKKLPPISKWQAEIAEQRERQTQRVHDVDR